VETHSKVRFCVHRIYSFVIVIDIIPDSRQELQAALGCACIRSTPVPVLDMYYGISYMICRLLYIESSFQRRIQFFLFLHSGLRTHPWHSGTGSQICAFFPYR
jgi:hypothetical protein